MERTALASRIAFTRHLHRALLVAGLGLPALSVLAGAQRAPRELRVEVRDSKGRRLPDARVDFPPGSDSAFTDSAGVARITIDADSLLTVSVRKIGYEPRAARFPVGRTPAFVIRVTLGDLGQRLPEVSIVAEYPGEPWRKGFEDRKHRSSGSFRERSFFAGREPQRLDDWFVGMPGAMMTSRGLRVNRCPRLGIWIDGMHVTQGGGSASIALMQLTATDIAAVELYRLAQQQSQYSDPNLEDCSLLVWTRTR
jgi:hypothetical protein